MSLLSLQLHHHPENYKILLNWMKVIEEQNCLFRTKRFLRIFLETKINERIEGIIILAPNLKSTIFVTNSPSREMLNNISSCKGIIK